LGMLIGIKGLALATSISAAVNAIALFFLLHRKIGDFGSACFFKILMKSAAGGVMMGFAADYGYRYLSEMISGIPAVLLTVLGSCVLYTGLELLLANEAVVAVVNGLRRADVN